jgi:hypothetical protein
MEGERVQRNMVDQRTLSPRGEDSQRYLIGLGGWGRGDFWIHLHCCTTLDLDVTIWLRNRLHTRSACSLKHVRVEVSANAD